MIKDKRRYLKSEFKQKRIPKKLSKLQEHKCMKSRRHMASLEQQETMVFEYN